MARSSFLNKSYWKNTCKCLFLQLLADFCQKRTIELSRHNARNLPDPNQCYHWLWQLHFEVNTVCGNLGLESFLNQIEVTTICGNFGLKLPMFVVTSVGKFHNAGSTLCWIARSKLLFASGVPFLFACEIARPSAPGCVSSGAWAPCRSCSCWLGTRLGKTLGPAAGNAPRQRKVQFAMSWVLTSM